jgi:hypothetical protein
MPLCIRYIDPDTDVPTIPKGFLHFTFVLDLSDSGIGLAILENLKIIILIWSDKI